MRSYTVERYLKTGSYTQTIGDFQSRFDPPKPLYKSLIVKLVMQFRQAGTLGDLRAANPCQKTHSGRKRIRSKELLSRFVNRLKSLLGGRPEESAKNWTKQGPQCSG